MNICEMLHKLFASSKDMMRDAAQAEAHENKIIEEEIYQSCLHKARTSSCNKCNCWPCQCINHHYWDRKNIHFCVEAYQSCQEVSAACGIKLSTWAEPGYKRPNDQPESIGYSFTCAPVSCPICIEWMEKNLHHCKNCQVLCVYNYCPTCAEQENIKARCKKCGKPLCFCEETK